MAAKEALPAPSPHIMLWQMWQAHAEKFRLFWGTFGPTLARRDRKNHPPAALGGGTPLFSGQKPPKKSGSIQVVVGTDPLHISCLSCGLQAAHANVRGGQTCNN